MAEISVIVPVYNVDNYIEQCVESVVNQKYSDFELLLIDDGSKDRSGLGAGLSCGRSKGGTGVEHLWLPKD